MSAQPQPLVEVAVVVAVFAGFSAAALATQRPERLYADAQKYQAMSVQFYEARRPIVEEGPFVYRVAVPWLAAALRPVVERTFPAWHRRIDGEVGMAGIGPFLLINVAAALAGSILLFLYVKRFVAGALVPLVLVTAWMAFWHAPVRFVYFYPVNVDAVFLVCVLAALLVIEATRDRAALAGALAVAPIVFAGTLVRESMVLAAVVFAAARVLPGARRDPGRLWAVLVPFVAWGAALVLVRRIAHANPPYHRIVEALGIAREKPLFTWVLAWFFTFGPPAVAIVAAASRDVLAFLRTRPELGVLIALCGVAAFVGGTDTERILAWSAPAVAVLVGRAIAGRRRVLARMPLLVAALVVVQVASSRAFWPIPVGIDHVQRFADLGASWRSLAAVADKFLVIDNYYSNLWSFFGSRAVHAVTLFFDLMMTAAFALSIERVRRSEVWR